MIPCYIQNRDAMSVVQMVEKLRSCDLASPVVVDCGSTYPPLLDWLDRVDAPVVRVDPRHHNKAAFAASMPEPLGVYMASDGDLDISGLPTDFLVRMRDVLLDRPDLMKVGSALRLDDLPEDGPLTALVRDHEARFWSIPDETVPHAYSADIDTTLALYRSGHGWRGYGPSLRLAGPYTARHVPWYLTADNVTEDWLWYLRNLEVVSGLGWTPRLKELLCDGPTA